MFEHVSVFLSFIYAMGITRILESVTDLVNARDRVRWSALQVAWMLAVVLGLFATWFDLFKLHGLTSWPLPVVLLLFGQGLAQYFACSFVSVKVEEEGLVDMPAAYENQRALFLSAAIFIGVIALVSVWTGLGLPANTPRDVMTVGTLIIVGGILARLVALFGRSRGVQWAAVTFQLALLVGYLVNYWAT